MALNSNGDVYLTYADSDGANITKLSGADGSLVTSFGTGGSYDRQSDTAWMRTGTSATYGYGDKFGSEIVVLPDDSVFMLHPTDEGVYGTKWDSSDNMIFANRYLDIDRTSSNPWSYRASNSLVADKVGNIFYAQRYNSSTQHIHKFNADGTWIKSAKSPYLFYVDKIATNGEDIILVPRSEWYVDELDNELVSQQKYKVFDMRIVDEMDFYVARDTCFRFGAHAKHSTGSMFHKLGTPWGGSHSENIGNTGSAAPNNVFIWRTDDDNVLNATSSTCPSSTGLMSATTPVSIAGNGSELGYYVYSGMNGEGDWRMKYSSASAPVEHTIPHVIDMSYGADNQCIATPTGVQCKGYQGGGLGDAAETPSSTSYVTVGTLTGALDVSVGTDFVCALDGSGKPYCWGSNVKGRLGTGNNTTYTTPGASNTSTTFVSIESGAKHSCALTSAGAMECWGTNEEGQMAEALWNNSAKTGTKSYKSPNDIAELTMAGATTFSKVSIGTESLFTAALIDNGSIAVWGEYTGTVYTDHFVLNSGIATDVAAGTDHICYIENGAVTCVGNNSAGQTTVPTLTRLQLQFMLELIGVALDLRMVHIPAGVVRLDGKSEDVAP